MIDVLDIIKKISDKKKDDGKFPNYAMFPDVMSEVTNQVKAEINRLIKEKNIKYYNTINSFGFEVTETLIEDEDKSRSNG